MELFTINTGYFKLDGGAMFGVVPKVLWNKLNPADSNNLCTWAMRCLLVKKNNRLILIDNGIGNKQSEKFLSYYYLHGNDSIEKSLAKYGFSTNDITDVFLTHLHFDHCGGGIKWNKSKTNFEPVFKNAVYWSNSKHWNWALNPNPREKASFLKENILPMKELGLIKFTDKDNFDLFDIIYVNGHTEAQMLPVLDYKDTKVIFMADLIPSTGHIKIPYIMSYDVRPLETIKEKQEIETLIAENDYVMFFEHDPVYECCKIEKTEKSFKIKQYFKLEEL